MNPTDARAMALAVARDVMGWPVVEYGEAVRTSPTVVKRFPSVGRLQLWRNMGEWQKETWDPACNVQQALEVLNLEARVVAVAADQVARAEPLDEHDRERLGLALERITSAGMVLNGR